MSERAHARHRLARCVGRARSAPGVACVLTAADIPGENDASPVFHDDPVFAEDVVEYVGQSLFAVAAETDRRRRAPPRRWRRVEYEDLPALITVDEALAADADLLPCPA